MRFRYVCFLPVGIHPMNGQKYKRGKHKETHHFRYDKCVIVLILRNPASLHLSRHDHSA